MTFPAKSIRFHLTKRFVFLWVAFFSALASYSQVSNPSEDWWTTLANKHGIKYDSYTLHGAYCVLGAKTVEGETENFKDVTIISKGTGNYWIYQSKTASYDPKTTILKMDNCTMEQFKMDAKSLEPVKSYKHIHYTVNLEKETATMADLRPDNEIESVINKMFEESIQAGEQLDLEKMRRQVDDTNAAGFINSGKYYTTFDLLFSDYQGATAGIKSQKLTVEHKKITVLSGNAALLTANGQFSATTNADKIIQGKFFWTIVYEEIDKEWKIVHSHMTNERY